MYNDDSPCRPLITPEEIGTLARPCEADRDLALRCIEEAQMRNVRPRLGSPLYLRLIHGVTYGLLMDGGDYEFWPCGDRRTGPMRRSFGGLKKALAYYAYARILRNSGLTVTRYGVVRKNDEYGTRADSRDIGVAAEDAVEMGDLYMQECLVYIHDNPDLFPDWRGGEGMSADWQRCMVLGD
ncbi:MAG: hypothetical protein LUC33_00925 [Prevotellaceae bacterium]|nr:hypothetical protein [Prevotellaceae bacterium]